MDELHMQKQIGEGSFGKVYLAKWKETTVAVKVLTSTAGNDDEDFPIGLPNPLLQALTKARPPVTAHLKCALLQLAVLRFHHAAWGVRGMKHEV